MSKHNYSQYSKQPNTNKNNKPKVDRPNSAPEVKMELKPEAPVTMEPVMKPEAPVTMEPVVKPVEPVAPIKLVEETVETVTLPETVTGIVANCAKLNVRANPSTNAEIVDVLDARTEIQIDVSKSDNEWLKIYTVTGNEGYCMRKFVEAKL